MAKSSGYLLYKNKKSNMTIGGDSIKSPHTMSNWGIPCEVREVTHQEFDLKSMTKME